MKITSPVKSKRALVMSSAGVIIVAAAAFGAYQYFGQNNDTYQVANTGQVSSGDKPTNNSTPQANSNTADTSGGISSGKTSSDSPAQAPASTVNPAKPEGTFVSNHSPNLDSDPAPNKESSTCTTTPGVKCYIKFTQGDTVKQLPEKVTNADGNVSWTWTLQDIGLTKGDWTITAVAVNGSNTASTEDGLKLSVGA